VPSWRALVYGVGKELMEQHLVVPNGIAVGAALTRPNQVN